MPKSENLAIAFCCRPDAHSRALSASRLSAALSAAIRIGKLAVIVHYYAFGLCLQSDPMCVVCVELCEYVFRCRLCVHCPQHAYIWAKLAMSSRVHRPASSMRFIVSNYLYIFFLAKLRGADCCRQQCLRVCFMYYSQVRSTVTSLSSNVGTSLLRTARQNANSYSCKSKCTRLPISSDSESLVFVRNTVREHGARTLHFTTKQQQ